MKIYFGLFCLILVFAWVYFLDKCLRKYGKDVSLDNQSFFPPIEKKEQKIRFKMVDDFINDCQSIQQQYWSSLLTFNGLLIAVFTFIAIDNASHVGIVITVAVAILMCLLSSGLMVINYFSLIMVIRERAKVYSPFLNMPEPEREQKKKNHNELENSEREYRERNERWTIILLTFQCMVIVAVLALITNFITLMFKIFCYSVCYR